MPSNQALVSALSAYRIQPSSTALVVRPTTLNVVTTASATGNPPAQAIMPTLAQVYPATNFKLQIILKRFNAPSISDEGICEALSAVPNAHISEAILTMPLDMEENSDDLRTYLYYYANMVFLRSNSFVFESTGRTCNVQPLSSDLDMEKNVVIVDGALAYHCPFTGEICVIIPRNVLHAPSMEHNLIPSFMMRDGGV